jgi:hypothetical protein
VVSEPNPQRQQGRLLLALRAAEGGFETRFQGSPPLAANALLHCPPALFAHKTDNPNSPVRDPIATYLPNSFHCNCLQHHKSLRLLPAHEMPSFLHFSLADRGEMLGIEERSRCQ